MTAASVPTRDKCLADLIRYTHRSTEIYIQQIWVYLLPGKRCNVEHPGLVADLFVIVFPPHQKQLLLQRRTTPIWPLPHHLRVHQRSEGSKGSTCWPGLLRATWLYATMKNLRWKYTDKRLAIVILFRPLHYVKCYIDAL